MRQERFNCAIIVRMNPNASANSEYNKRAIEAGKSDDLKNAFLTKEQDHILHLTARILSRTVSMSDDEWSIAFIAVSEAVDSYDETRGNFWNYAALVIRSRLNDFYRKNRKASQEITVSVEAFDTDFDEEDMPGIQIEIKDKTAVVTDTRLRDELDAFEGELSTYGISLFELPEHAPKSLKTKESCARLIKAFFEPPPPIIDEFKTTGNLPVKGLMSRTGITRKLIDKYRKFLIAGALIKDGDYPQMADYLP